MELKIENWGNVDGQDTPVKLFSLINSQGLILKVTNFGCIVTSIEVPGRNGVREDVVLGYDSLEKYLAGHPFFGAIAGRYANRIEGGRYQLDGEVFQLDTNEVLTQQHLHGGLKGFDKYVWDFEVDEQPEATYIHFSRVSTDGESGYGGTLHVKHT
ncbi:MAG TPA: galactose-1-epimerase, partial [Vibrio sp.]|nr:galactose-1-epimerase [Vibrio sp.]